MNQTPKLPVGSLETHRMVTSPPRSRARRAAQSEKSVTQAKSAVPSGAQIAAALLDRAHPPRSANAVLDAERGGTPCANTLLIRKTVCGPRATLYLVGALNTLTTSQFRDEAFTAIGARPTQLCLDLTGAETPDAAALDSLVTIASVARMMGVAFSLRASAPLICVLQTSHLSRLIPLDETGDLEPSPAPRVDWLEPTGR